MFAHLYSFLRNRGLPLWLFRVAALVKCPQVESSFLTNEDFCQEFLFFKCMNKQVCFLMLDSKI